MLHKSALSSWRQGLRSCLSSCSSSCSSSNNGGSGSSAGAWILVNIVCEGRRRFKVCHFSCCGSSCSSSRDGRQIGSSRVGEVAARANEKSSRVLVLPFKLLQQR